MKLIVFLSSACFAVAALPARENTNVSPMAVVASAQQLFSTIRREVSNGIEAKLKNKTILSTDLAGILAMLDAQTNKLARAAFDQKLDFLAQQVEKIPKQAGELLRDPRNKAMAATLDTEKWRDEVLRQKTLAKILVEATGRLRSALAELHAWSKALEPLAKPDEIGARLKSRLAELLTEWRSQKPETSQETEKVEADTAKPLERAGGDAPANENAVNHCAATTDSPQSITVAPRTRSGSGVPVYRVVQVTPAVGQVLQWADSGAEEAQILNAIGGSAGPFNLTSGQIIALRERLCSHIISAMLRRDGELRGIAARQGRR